MAISSALSSALSTLKAQYTPVKDDKVKLTMNGDIACYASGEYRAFINDELTNVPDALLLSVPMYRIAKPIDQIQAGDIIKTTAAKTMKNGDVNPEGKYTYRRVKEVKDGKIVTETYGGTANSTVTPVKEFFTGQKTASVVVNLFAGAIAPAAGQTAAAAPFGAINPMLFALLGDKKGGSSDLLPLMLMQQGGAANGFNPMTLALLADKGGDDIMETMVLMQLMQGGNGINLATLFGGSVVAPAAAPTADATQA